ncbi:MAG: DUF4388 domain-containing protein [bacterium]|nr:DUF4388 domain-containing protein [bacterium]
MDPNRNTFLTENLADAVQQLDLILRVLDDGQSGEAKTEGRQTLLKRFFHRAEDETPQEGTGEFEAPALNASHQGLQGNSWSVPMTELLNFLAFSRKTGVLWVDTPTENYMLGITDGILMHGSSDHSPEGLRIGEVLVGFGFITRRQLDRFIANTEGCSTTGESLLENGMITADELRHALVYQVQQLFIRLATQQHAIFHFREGFEVPQAYQVRMDINQLLLSTAQARDEVANHEVRDQAMQQNWNSWTSKLSDQVSKTKESETAEAASEEEVKDAAPIKETASKATASKATAAKESPPQESKQRDTQPKATETAKSPKSIAAPKESIKCTKPEGKPSDNSTPKGAMGKEASADKTRIKDVGPHDCNGGGKRKAS